MLLPKIEFGTAENARPPKNNRSSRKSQGLRRAPSHTSSPCGSASSSSTSGSAVASTVSKMHFSKRHFSKILQIFGGLVLGCIKTKFCKKICVRQHFSSSTRIASFCTVCNLKIFAKNRFEKTAIFVKF